MACEIHCLTVAIVVKDLFDQIVMVIICDQDDIQCAAADKIKKQEESASDDGNVDQCFKPQAPVS